MLNNHPFYAYGEERSGVEAVMRLHAVKRWHMIDTTRIQTLAEHSANVGVLAFYIAKTAPGMFFGPSECVATYALLHDIEEVFTGDIPSHTKRALKGVTELEDATLPPVFQVGHDPNMRIMVKMCDLADGIRFIRLHGVDVTARHAREGLERQLCDWEQEAHIIACWPQEVYHHVFDNIRFYAYEVS